MAIAYPTFGSLIAAMVSAAAGNRASTIIQPTLPVDLAAAIVAFFEESPLATSIPRIYRDKAGEKPGSPYLIYSVTSGAPILTTSTSYWFDQRVRFTVYSTDSAEANALREQVWKTFQGISLDFETGFSIPFFPKNRSEGMELSRTSNNSYLFKATIEVSARTSRKD